MVQKRSTGSKRVAPTHNHPRFAGQERGGPLDTEVFAGDGLEQAAGDQDRPAAGRGDVGGRSPRTDPDVDQGRTEAVAAQGREHRGQNSLVRHGRRRTPAEQPDRERLHPVEHERPGDQQPRREQGQAGDRRQQRAHRAGHCG